MDPKTHIALEQAITDYDARADDVQIAAERVISERDQFLQNFRNATQDIILPALGEIQLELEKHGWKCDAIPSKESDSIKFEIFRGEMVAAGGQSRPFINFAALPDSSEVEIYSATQSEGSGQDRYPTSQVTPDFVQQQVLAFVQKLAAEPIN